MTRTKIKEVAIKLFAQKGYDATTMNDIAEGVGIKAAAIYAHFLNKEELFFELVEDISQQVDQALNKSFEPVIRSEHYDARQVLYDIFLKSILYFVNRKEQFNFWQRVILFPPQVLIEKAGTKYRKTNAHNYQVVSDIFIKGIDDKQVKNGSINAYIMSYYSLLAGYIAYAFKSLDEKKFNEAEVEKVWNLYWMGLKAGVNI